MRRGSEGSACAGLAPRAIRKTNHVALRLRMLQEAGRPAPAAAAPRPAPPRCGGARLASCGSAVEPPVDRRPVAAAQRQLVAARQARRRSRRARPRAGARRSRARGRSATRAGRDRAAPSGLNESLPGCEVAAVEPGHEHPVEADRRGRAGSRACGTRRAGPRAGRSRRGCGSPPGPRATRRRSRGRRRPRPAPASGEPGQASTPRALVEQLGQGAPEPRVARGDGERAFLQARAGDVGAADAARRRSRSARSARAARC